MLLLRTACLIRRGAVHRQRVSLPDTRCEFSSRKFSSFPIGSRIIDTVTGHEGSVLGTGVEADVPLDRLVHADFSRRQQAEDFSPSRWGAGAEQYGKNFGAKFQVYAEVALRRVLTPQLPLSRFPAALLDSGCGTGAVIAAMCALPKELRRVNLFHGVDFSPEMIEICRSNIENLRVTNPEWKCEVKLERKDGQNLSGIEDGYFDVALGLFSVLFYPRRHVGLRELKRVLKPGGLVCVSGWAPPHAVEWVRFSNAALKQVVGEDELKKLSAGDSSFVPPNFLSWSDRSVLAEELSEAGFEAVETEAVTKRFELGEGLQGVQAAEKLWHDMAASFPTLAFVLEKLTSEEVDSKRLHNEVACAFGKLIKERGGLSSQCWLEGTAHFGTGSA